MKAIEAVIELEWSASAVARRVMQVEAEAISAVATRLDDQFDRA